MNGLKVNSLPILPILRESEILTKVAEERARLEKENGIVNKEVKHFKKPVELRFTRKQRDHTTILFGGLTLKHEQLIISTLEGFGYKMENLSMPDVKACQTGKEYGNNGQCNPTYFTVGNLVQHLQKLEEQGQTKQQIIDNYVFFTAGNACGTCRFAMYEAEYRLALKNSGFDGFRVLTFNLVGGLEQKGEDAPGLEMGLDFFLGVINSILIGDLLNEVGYLIRPYEVNPGETDRVLTECTEEVRQVMKAYKPFMFDGRIGRLLKTFKTLHGIGRYLGEIYQQLYGSYYTATLKQVAHRLNQIPVDRTRIKPTVKITGEFWAHITEGDGNFHMFRFLEGEGAQVIIEPVGSLIQHMVRQIKDETRERSGVEFLGQTGLKAAFGRMKSYLKSRKKLALLYIADKAFVRKWNHLRNALNNLPHAPIDQYELMALAHEHYNSKARGGESHLEIAKNIFYHKHHLCHMVLSLKPFGCMPSTQSDGVQAGVMNKFKEMIFLPIETAGEGEINAHSRVQMALGEAKFKAKEEFARVLAETGHSLDDIQTFIDENPKLKEPFYLVPHYDGISGTAANFVRHVAESMR